MSKVFRTAPAYYDHGIQSRKLIKLNRSFALDTGNSDQVFISTKANDKYRLCQCSSITR